MNVESFTRLRLCVVRLSAHSSHQEILQLFIYTCTLRLFVKACSDLLLFAFPFKLSRATVVICV